MDTLSFLWKEVPRRGRGWMGIAVFPHQAFPSCGHSPYRHFERKREIFFRLRSSRRCGDSGIPDTKPSPRGEGAPKGRIGQERYERERRRSSQVRRLREHPSAAGAVPLPRWGRQRGGGFAAKKEKPTPPRCARQPLPREGARVDAPSFLWKEVPRRGGGWMGMPLSPTQSLPRVGKVASGASWIGF